MNKTLMEKILAAQSKMEAASQNQWNNFFKSNYADLNSIVNATRPVFAAEGLLIYQEVETTKDMVWVQTFVSDGEETHGFGKLGIGVVGDVGQGGDIKPVTQQSYGKSTTYARRYSWQFATGVPEEDGKDSVGQQGPPQGRQQQRPNQQRPQQNRQQQRPPQGQQRPAQGQQRPQGGQQWPPQGQQQPYQPPQQQTNGAAPAQSAEQPAEEVSVAQKAKDLLDGLDPDPTSVLSLDKYQGMLHYLGMKEHEDDAFILGQPLMPWIQEDQNRNIRMAAVKILEYMSASVA